MNKLNDDGPAFPAMSRFERFQEALFDATGDACFQTNESEVVVMRNEFTPERRFRSVQEAIDHFSRHMPDELTRENK